MMAKIKGPSLFPSRRMTLYMGKMFLVRTFAFLAVLVLVIQVMDMLGEAGSILAYPGNGNAALWHYAGLRFPQLLDTFLPYSVLVGTLWTFFSLNMNSEIISMKSAGMSAHQILAPAILASLLVAVISFAFSELIATPATDNLMRWQSANYGPLPPEKTVKDDVWATAGDNLIHAQYVSGEGATTRLSGVTVYVRQGGALGTLVQGAAAYQQGSGWRMDNAQQFDTVSGSALSLPRFDFAQGVSSDRFTLSNINAERTSILPLGHDIHALRAAGRPTNGLQAGWWHKISKPLSTLLMPLLGSVAAFGLARSGKLNIRLMIGGALGFLYFISDNAALSLGSIGVYPPLLAAWGPFLLFLFIGETVLVRTEE